MDEQDPLVMVVYRRYVTGATEDDGFGGLAGGDGGRRSLVLVDSFDPATPDPTFRCRRTDTGQTVEVTDYGGDVPDGGPAIGDLRQILDESASDQQREAFSEARHRRVQVVLGDDSPCTVETG